MANKCSIQQLPILGVDKCAKRLDPIKAFLIYEDKQTFARSISSSGSLVDIDWNEKIQEDINSGIAVLYDGIVQVADANTEAVQGTLGSATEIMKGMIIGATFSVIGSLCAINAIKKLTNFKGFAIGITDTQVLYALDTSSISAVTFPFNVTNFSQTLLFNDGTSTTLPSVDITVEFGEVEKVTLQTSEVLVDLDAIINPVELIASPITGTGYNVALNTKCTLDKFDLTDLTPAVTRFAANGTDITVTTPTVSGNILSLGAGTFTAGVVYVLEATFKDEDGNLVATTNTTFKFQA